MIHTHQKKNKTQAIGTQRGRVSTIHQKGGSALPEDGEIDFQTEVQELQEKIAELEKEISELRVQKKELKKQMELQIEEQEKLEQENIELQDQCDSLNERIVQMKIEYRSATKDDHDETAALLRKDRGTVKIAKNANKNKNANACVMFGWGIW